MNTISRRTLMQMMGAGAAALGTPFGKAGMAFAARGKEIDLYLPGGTYSVSPARADGYPQMRSITPLKGPIDGKGGLAWFEITSAVNNPDLSPLALEFLKYVQAPDVAYTVATAESTCNPVTQMGNPECFALFTKDELEAMQWDSPEEEISRCVDYDIVPDYNKALDLVTAAKRMKS